MRDEAGFSKLAGTPATRAASMRLAAARIARFPTWTFSRSLSGSPGSPIMCSRVRSGPPGLPGKPRRARLHGEQGSPSAIAATTPLLIHPRMMERSGGSVRSHPPFKSKVRTASPKRRQRLLMCPTPLNKSRKTRMVPVCFRAAFRAAAALHARLGEEGPLRSGRTSPG